MLHLSFLLLALQAPKIEATLAQTPEALLVCTGTAEVSNGMVLNLELFLEGRAEALKHMLVQVKGGMFAGTFDFFKAAGRILPGTYTVKIIYHPSFQPPRLVLEGVDPFRVTATLQVGTKDDVVIAHKAARERLTAELKTYGVVADEVVAAFEKAKGKVVAKEWQTLVDGWRLRCAQIEDRAAKDPDYHALGYGGIVRGGTEFLREKVRGMVEFGGAGRAAELQLGRKQLDEMIRSTIVDLAPAGSTTADIRTLVGQARGALVSALDAEGPAFAGCRRGFLESVQKLGNNKAPPEAAELLAAIAADGATYFLQADADRKAGRKLQPDLDKKLAELLQLLTKSP